MARIGIAFVGTGFIAGYHLDALATIPDADIRVVVGRDPAKAAAFAAQRGIPAGTSDLDATLARGDIAAIVVASPDDTHEAICLKAIEAGKAILVQKPMAPDAAACRRMIAAAQAAKVDLQVSFMHRYFEEFAAARELIAAGEIGTPTSARMRNATPGPDWGDWFFKKSRVGGGVVLQLGVHGIDLLTQLFGPVASLNATTAILRPERLLADGRVVTVENPDSAWATYRFANGVAASHDMSMIEAAGTDRFGMEIYGTDGTIQLRGVAGALRLRRKGATAWETPALPTPPLGQRHHQRWLDGLSATKPKETTARDALAGLLIAEAIERSAAQGGAATEVEQP